MSELTEEAPANITTVDLQAQNAAPFIAEQQVKAAQCVASVSDVITLGAKHMANTIRTGNTLYYAAAGSSGLMAAADAMELGGTFNIDFSQVRILMAGGIPQTAHMPGDTEDAINTVKADLSKIKTGDTVIAVSASGNTPYTVEAAITAKRAGATVIGIANNATGKLLTICDCPIFLNTPAEVVGGSTRMGAGTAQKIALNSLSTLMAVELGHIYNGMMVNLRADNTKLKLRAIRIVASSAQVQEDTAKDALRTSDGNVKLAVLIAAGATSINSARRLLDENNGQLRTALSRLIN